jgi:hypothetical protein
MPGQPSNTDGKTSLTRRPRKVILSGAAVAVVLFIVAPPKLPLTEAVGAQERAAAPLLPEIAGPALVEPLNDGLRAALDRAFAHRAQCRAQ